jgi:hypothetical protein
MKNVFSLTAIALFLGIFTTAFGQEIDPRLVKNRGKQAQVAFEYNTNGYNYFLYELDSSYQVVNLETLTRNEKKLLRKDISFTGEQLQSLGTSSFNYFDLGIRLSSTNRQYILVDKTTVLIFFAIPEVTSAFSKSPLNTK